MSLTVSPVRDASGAIIGATKIVRDVSAEHASHARNAGPFLGTLSDLRNPLNAIAISVHTLKRHASGGGPESARANSSSTDRMTRMIDQLLTSRRVVSEGHTDSPATCRSFCRLPNGRG